MKRTFTRCVIALFVVIAVVGLFSRAVAQTPASALLSSMAVNAKQLRPYTFKQRTETYHKGELRNAKVDDVHYNTSGERISIPLEEQRTQFEAPRRGPGHRIVARKMEEEKDKMKDYVQRLMSLTSRYLASDPAKLQAAVANAEVTTGGGTSHVRLRMRDYVKSGDSMTMIFDPATKRPVRTEVNTSLDDDPVTIVLSFDQIHEGPNYPGKTVVRADARQLEVRVYTYDYRL